jgi:hypothetical protein
MKKLGFIFLFSVLGMAFTSCNKKDCIDGDEFPRGAIRELPPFSAINVNLSAVVELVADTSQNTPYVEIVVEENLETHLATTVINDTLEISLGFCFSSHADILIRVHYDTLNTITVSGPGDIISKTKMLQDQLTLNIRSSGDIDLTTDLNHLITNINGTGLVTINGQLKRHTINHNNSGTINTYQAMTDFVFANINSSGNSYLRVKNELNVKLNNSGNIYFKGNPIINDVIIGSGELINDN